MPILFADDTNLFCTNAKLDILVNEINVELNKICTWVRVNKLSLNIEKTNFMLFTPKGFSRNMDCISIDGHKIEEVKQTKFLGVILDNKLNWHAHCEYICGKISKGIGIIIKVRKVFNETTLLSLYNSLILPYVSYCIDVWGKAYDTHLKHVMVLQNKAVRVIAGVPPRTNADNLYLELDVLSVKKIFVYAISIFMYKYMNGMLPELFRDMFTPISDIHSYDTRQAKNKKLFVSFKSTSRGQQSVTYIGPHVWNFILSKINPICSIGSFKKHIRQLLQHCSVSDLTWWSLTLKQKCSPDLDLHVNIFIYIYIWICMFCMYLYVYVYVCVLFFFISFISLSMSETNIRPCIALWKIALYRNVALLLVPLHPVLKTIYLEIDIRAHKPRLPALIVMKDCYQFFFLIYCTFTCLQLVKIV